jgi:hypothetical protein
MLHSHPEIGPQANSSRIGPYTKQLIRRNTEGAAMQRVPLQHVRQVLRSERHWHGQSPVSMMARMRIPRPRLCIEHKHVQLKTRMNVPGRLGSTPQKRLVQI